MFEFPKIENFKKNLFVSM